MEGGKRKGKSRDDQYILIQTRESRVGETGEELKVGGKVRIGVGGVIIRGKGLQEIMPRIGHNSTSYILSTPLFKIFFPQH